ncbi:hypothetical protein K2D_07760 [Planctomycetes bacterium K2D]|nr:hypothetical protein K2D_07760 [Planctomycetes bacterium K2D]
MTCFRMPPWLLSSVLLLALASLCRSEATIEKVTVAADRITIVCNCDDKPGFSLREHPLWSDGPIATWLIDGPAKRHTFELQRRPKDGGIDRDRLLSRWSVGPAVEEAPASMRYADTVTTAVATPHPTLRSKKGLGGFDVGRGFLSDIEDLGVSTVTVNVMLDFLYNKAATGRDAFTHAGQRFYIDRGAIARLDKTLQFAADHELLVFAIILLPKPTGEDSPRDAMAHPDYEPEGMFPMPDVTSQQGVTAYSAALEFLAQRYLQSSGPRIHHWILHNEVDAGLVWTNAGKKSQDDFLDLYAKSLRIAHLTARQYDANSRVFASVTHSWTRPEEPRFYAGREVLEGLIARSRAHGDFDWGIAYHPYPQSLFVPETWRDEEAIDSPDSPLVTFKNLGVLVDWARDPVNRFKGEAVRDIYLTEQGFHSRDYSDRELELQSAALAYAWRRLTQHPEIKAMHYHNWIDNRHEGGLRIGLRKFPDDADNPGGVKPIWNLYRDLGEPNEEAAMQFSDKIIESSGDGR